MSETVTKPDSDEMQKALASVGVEWSTEDESGEWLVSGLENGPEPAETCEAGIRRMMGAAEFDGARDERERVRTRLADHFLVEIRCDHEARTDVAICSCALWASVPQPTVGEAVAAWIAHATEELG